MHNKIMIVLIAATIALCFASCKKDDRKVVDEEFKLSQSASVNKEIHKLRNALTAAKDDNEKSALYMKIASLESDKGDVASAIKSAQEAMRLMPDQYQSRYILGKSLNETGRFDDAIIELKASIDLKNDFAAAHYELGNALYKKLKYQNAIAEYSEAVKHDPTLYQAYNNMGVVQCALGKTTDAEKSFQTVIQTNPRYAAVYKNLGILYETKMKLFPKAVEQYIKYLEVFPNCPERNRVRHWIKVLGG